LIKTAARPQRSQATFIGLSLCSFFGVFWSLKATDFGSLRPRGLFSKREYSISLFFQRIDKREAKVLFYLLASITKSDPYNTNIGLEAIRNPSAKPT
jgi:hypothetical protein